MMRTYPALLSGDRVEWIGDRPEPGTTVRVHVTLLDEDAGPQPGSAADRGRRMADALGGLAASGAFASIADPAEWQRELRADRSLPDRDA